MTRSTGQTQETQEKRCSVCGAIKSLDEFYFIRGEYQDHCKVCERARSNEAHRRARIKVNDSRTWGVEIEFYAPLTRAQVAQRLTDAGVTTYAEEYNHSRRSHWKIVTDASVGYRGALRGMELVSPPLAGEEGWKQLRAALKTLRSLGAEVDRSCGIHVHHDARDLSVQAWKRLLSATLKFETVIDSFHPQSRRNNQYANTMTNSTHTYSYEPATIERIQACSTRAELTNFYRTRYMKVNTHSFVKHGTVEFRQHAGSLNFEKVLNWVALTQRIVEASVEGRNMKLRSDATITNFASAIKLQPSVKRFFVERAQALAA